MQKLEQITGQEEAIQSVLAKEGPGKKVYGVLGPQGGGVSWTLDQCGHRWEELGGAALAAKGERYASERHLFPWLTLALPGAKRLARLEILKGGLAQGSRVVPVVGSVASYLVEEVLNHRKRRLKREALVLTDQEQDLLFVIQATARQKHLLLALDDLELWDEASWSLLALILSDRLHELYPFLENTTFVLGLSGTVPTRLREALGRLPLTELRLRALDLREIPVALATFGFPPLDAEQVEQIFQMTNGQLDLLNDVGRYLRSVDLTTSGKTWPELYASVLQRRIGDLREHAKDLEDMLAAAAVIGTAFTISEVACLTGSAADVIATTLRFASAEHFTWAIGDIVHFSSAELHQYFHSTRSSEHAQYHARFADCLRVMRPGDYGHRAHHLLLSGNTEAALTCHALSALSARRDYHPPPDPGELKRTPTWPDIRRYLDIMFNALEAYEDERIGDGLRMLDGVEAFLPEALVAERDHLEALLLLAAPTIANYGRAQVLLQRWSTLADRESELWARIAQTLMVAHVQTGRIEEARQLETQLTAEYWKRRNVDPWALYGLNVLRRRAECLHALPTATQRLESAITYFGPSSGDPMPRHPIQYYYTLTNLVGNLLATGRFHEACTKATLLEDLIRRYASLPWPSPQIAANNSILARHLADALDPSSAAELARSLVTGSSESGDSVLLRNNYAVLTIKAGDLPTARATLESALATLLSDRNPDGYHRYFVSNNLAGLLALDGNLPRALELVHDCDTLLDQFYPAVQQTMLRRQELIGEAVRQAPNLSPDEFDRFLLQRHGSQVGPQWAFYGRGFLLSDIQFWSAA